MLSHVSLGTNEVARAAAFYDPVLAVLGMRKICERDLVFEWWVGTMTVARCLRSQPTL